MLITAETFLSKFYADFRYVLLNSFKVAISIYTNLFSSFITLPI